MVPDASLRDTVLALSERQAALDTHDAEIATFLRSLEGRLRGLGITQVHAVPWDEAQLAWSGAKGRWRFIIRDDDSVIDLLNATRIERATVLSKGVLRALLLRIGILA